MTKRFFFTVNIAFLFIKVLLPNDGTGPDLFFDAAVLSNQQIGFVRYLGAKTYLTDTVRFDVYGKATCRSPQPKGIFVLLLPDGTNYEFMISEESCHFRISGSRDKYIVSVRGSAVSEAFADFKKDSEILLYFMDSLKKSDALQMSKEDKAEKIQYFRKRLIEKKEKYIHDYPGTLLAHYLLAQLPVSVPDFAIPEDCTNPDSLRWIRKLEYYQNHFLDHIAWQDEGLIYTPVLEVKINTYLDRVIQQNHRVLANTTDSILAKTNNEEVREFVIRFLTQKYGMERSQPISEYVYVHLIEKYYLRNQPTWLSSRERKFIKNEYNRLNPNILGRKAPNVEMPDAEGMLRSFEEMDVDFMVLVFWDPDCPKCKRVMDEINEIISDFKHLDIGVFTVCTRKDTSPQGEYVKSGFSAARTAIHVFGNESVLSKYNISNTPAIFLLNREKVILDKSRNADSLNQYFSDSF